MLVGLRRKPNEGRNSLCGTAPIDASQRDPPALRAPAGREPDRAPALRPVADRARVCFVPRPAAMRTGIASASLRASEAAALGAYATVIANRTTELYTLRGGVHAGRAGADQHHRGRRPGEP